MRIRDLAFVTVLAVIPAFTQGSPKSLISSGDRARAHVMLSTIYAAMRSHYYDPSFHGVDMDARFKKYDAELDTQPTLGAAYRVIAAFMAGLHDSHTFFLPPPVSNAFFYGIHMQMLGDRCFITAVRPETDAATKVQPGDEIVSLNGYTVNRADYEPLAYDLFTLEPRGGLRLKLRNPSGVERDVEITTKVVNRGMVLNSLDPWQGEMDEEADEAYNRPRWYEAGSVFIWQQPTFLSSEDVVDSMVGKARHDAGLVIDLRGNGGGSLDLLKYMLGYFLPERTEVAEFTGRKHQDPLQVKPHNQYQGKLVVLVDSMSASAAEMFARAIQLNHRGTVVGDRSAGAVMESEIFPFESGSESIMVYGASITREDVLMQDGKSLENAGISPDVELVPTGADLAAGRDIVLSRAVALAGGSLPAAAAGHLFAYRWPPFTITH